MKEAAVKDAVKKHLTARGIYWFMPPGVGYGRAGIPDIVCCYGGHFVAIECKGDGGRTTALQDRELESIRAAGGTALVVTPHNLPILESLIDRARAV